MAVLGYSIFIDRDLNYANRVLDPATSINRTQPDVHDRLIMQTTEFMMSRDFERECQLIVRQSLHHLRLSVSTSWDCGVAASNYSGT
jgi:hypothetical protein